MLFFAISLTCSSSFAANPIQATAPNRSFGGELPVSADALRLAVVDLISTFGDRYIGGQAFLQRLDAISKQDAATASSALQSLQREALLANPLVSEQPILYVWRNQYKIGGHHAIDTLFQNGENNTRCFTGPGALKTIDLTTGKAAVLVDAPEGIVRDPQVSFDGKRIVFALRRNIQEDYHLWEVNADGSGLRQLTKAGGVSDFNPLYLPDDRIAFSSTREPKYNQCSRDLGANLFCMESDGANIHQISKNNLIDSQGTLDPDGRILYARWEYVDRNFADAHSIWTVNPDGTSQTLYWGNNKASPAGVYYPHIIPGSRQLLCIFGMHHYRMWGALAMVDRQKAIDGRPAVVRTWPADVVDRVRTDGFDPDGFVKVYPKYECPYPLSDKYFLCSRMTMRSPNPSLPADARYGEEMGIYLIDVFGNEILIHADAPGCYDPMPLKAHPRPPVIPSRRDFENKEGAFFVTDVYQGTHMRGVQRGSVKALRVVEVPEKRNWSAGSWNGQGYTAPGMNWHDLTNKRILGTVPVAADGSAYFSMPSEKFVYFQLLDENGLMIQSMRSGASVQSGERTGCVGCHENRLSPPPPRGIQSMAMRHEPDKLEGWHGPAREFSFMAEVQPVFTKHCVACHDYGQAAGTKLNLAPDRTLTFNTAYMELWRKGYTGCIGAGPAEIQQAYSWGSHVSKLVKELRSPTVPEHKDLKLTPEDIERIVTWVDLNGPYYPSYASAYPDNLSGRAPLDSNQIKRLGELTGWSFDKLNGFKSSRGPDVSFERPELSPCLAELAKDSPTYLQALGIIRAGAEMLAKRPNPDMPGFQPCETDRRREEKYEERRRIEMQVWEAIRSGRKVYDAPAPARQ